MQKVSRTPRLPRARPDLTFRTLGSEFALYDRSGIAAQTLNLTAALIWTYCDGRHDAGAIAAAVARDLPEAGDLGTVEHRVALLLAQFAARGMLA